MNLFDNTTPTEELLHLLSQARAAQGNYKSIKSTIIEQAKATGDYQFAEEGDKTESATIEALTAEIKDRALATYYATKEKKPFVGVTVKIFKVFKVKVNSDMEAWVEKNFVAAISRVFDMKLIESFAKSNPNTVPGTEIVEEPRAEIAKDLP